MEILEGFDKLSIADQRECERELYRNDLYAFTKYGLGYSELTRRTHGPICDALQEDTRRKLLCLPRGAFKSTIACVAYPIWLLIRNPNERILLSSEVFSNAKNFIREIKMHLKSQLFVSLYGDWEGVAGWGQHELLIANRTIPHKEASITAGGIETQKVGQHYNIIILDDLSSPSNTHSPEMQQKVIQFYQYQTSILEPDGTIVVIGTRYAENDIIGWILENEIDKETVDGLKDKIKTNPTKN